MNEYSVGPKFVALAMLRMGVVCDNPWARCVREFLPVLRNRGRLVDLAKEIASESFDEMLVAIPGVSSAKFSNPAGVPVQYLSLGVLSPFGDW